VLFFYFVPDTTRDHLLVIPDSTSNLIRMINHRNIEHQINKIGKGNQIFMTKWNILPYTNDVVDSRTIYCLFTIEDVPEICILYVEFAHFGNRYALPTKPISIDDFLNLAFIFFFSSLLFLAFIPLSGVGTI
jgi:hypothetical protein